MITERDKWGVLSECPDYKEIYRDSGGWAVEVAETGPFRIVNKDGSVAYGSCDSFYDGEGDIILFAKQFKEPGTG